MDPALLKVIIEQGSTFALAVLIIWRVDGSLKDLAGKVDTLNRTLLDTVEKALTNKP